jgi:hypothetical protein
MSISMIGGGKAQIDSEPEESLDVEDEHDSTDGTESSIRQYTTQPSSDYVGADSGTILLRAIAKAGTGVTSTLASFPFGA